MLDASAIDTIEKIGGALLIGALHAYYAQQRAVTRARITTLAQQVSVDYADVKTDIDALHASLESLTVKLQGGDRRAARAATTDNLAQAQARRWTDPTLPRPAGT